MAWVGSVCGRLKSDYRYSNLLVYNNYPWPTPTEKQKINIEELAQIILNIRLKYSESTLGDLYDPISMPADLVKAHDNLNRAVDVAYGKFSFENESERLAFLFSKYKDYFIESEKIKNLNNYKAVDLKRNSKRHELSDLRLTLAGMVVKSLANSKGFGKTKFAKVFYIADMMCDQDLGTKYYREVAGPIDYNVLYHSKHKIEILAEKHEYFFIKKVGNRFRYILEVIGNSNVKRPKAAQKNRYFCFGYRCHYGRLRMMAGLYVNRLLKDTNFSQKKTDLSRGTFNEFSKSKRFVVLHKLVRG